ncbi:unnamed protein product [Owenia fusiformis]|uniref:Exosome complex component RRP45 n=1 Tax=Owenia fusiformis TaxID=6347 RepID=A0A8J1THQ9_OWEFU|nr:unnamed protein product [Owenia fusiformis]
MRDNPLSICEREFILAAVEIQKRIDGREPYDLRKIKITFGLDYGCCHVELGKTRVMAQVSCEIAAPKQTRLNEGTMFINVELSPMAAPQFETRSQDLNTEITRLLERSIKNSRCVDLESLCIMAGEKVWELRVDVHVLNHEGNILDCANIAAIAALAHFRRPDVTVCGEEITVHPADERDPVPLSILHMPLCVTFAFFHNGKCLILDPNEREERVMDGKMVVSMNKHREICTLQISGQMLLEKDQIFRCTNMAVKKVIVLTELIQLSLENDSNARAAGEKFGFAESVETNEITTEYKEESEVDMSDIDDQVVMATQNGNSEDGSIEELELDMETKVTIMFEGTGMIGQGGANTWDMDEDMESDLTEHKQKPQANSRSATIAKHIGGDLSGESEEEDTVMLQQEDIGLQSKPIISSEEPTGNEIDLTAALAKPRGKKKKSKHKH